MGDEAKALGGTDKWYDRLSSYLSARISAFVAFLFLLFAAGTFYGAYVVARLPDWEVPLVLAPIALAILAYYSRGFATVAFVFLILFAFIL